MEHIVVGDIPDIDSYGMDVARFLEAEFLPVKVVKYKAGEIKPILLFKGQPERWASKLEPYDIDGKDMIVAFRDNRVYPDADKYLRKNYLIVNAIRNVERNFDIEVDVIDAIMPYLYYARQDRAALGEPCSLEEIAKELESKTIERLFTYNSHIYGREDRNLGQYFSEISGMLGHSTIPHDIPLAELFAEKLIDFGVESPAIINPDGDSISRLLDIFDEFDVRYVNPFFRYVLQKRQPDGSKKFLESYLNGIEGETAIIVDDLSDSGGTLIRAIDEVSNHNPKEIFVVVTHIFDEEPIRRLIEKKKTNPLFKTIITSDSLYLDTTQEKEALVADYRKNFHEIDTTKFIADYIKEDDLDSLG